MSDLAGKRVLIVEDDPILSLTLEDVVNDAGATVVGPAAWLHEALELATSEALDLAILDININGGLSYAVADTLARRKVPYLFATGYDQKGIENAAGAPVLRKPFAQQMLLGHLSQLLAR